MKESMLEIKDLHVVYRTEAGEVKAVNDVALSVKKGDVLGTARIAGIMAAKKTSDLIPMCHPLMLTKVTVDFEMKEEDHTIHCYCTTKLCGKTGVEMEALTGVNVALLTIYDMCKAMDRSMEMSGIHLVEKMGGKSGHFINRK